jgi:outer membrane protein
LSFAAGLCFAADGESPWMIRVRALGIFPDVSSSQITTIRGEADVDDAYTLDLDISYLFTENIALELTLAYAQHDVSTNNTILGTVNLGSLILLPPTLTLQYHFMPKNAFRPYIGAGVSYVLIPDYDAGPVATSIDHENGKFGAAIQFGFDYFCVGIGYRF